MKVLVIGGGGREHALAWKLAQSPRVDTVYVAPGNAGTAREPKVANAPAGAEDVPGLLHFAEAQEVDMTVVGPEAPLVAGIVDSFQNAGLPIFGPTREAAAIEGSKAFAKAFMRRHAIPTPQYGEFTELSEAFDFVKDHGAPLVVKADGLASGKGVVIARSNDEAMAAARAMLRDDAYGPAGRRIVIEEHLAGEEASFICMVDGYNVVPLASSQDHKPRDDADRGPNTGGMGAYSPAPVMDADLMERVIEEIIQPTVSGLAYEGLAYSGFLYAGLMITPEGDPKVLEFNCRFGDPEAQPILMRLESDLADLVEAGIQRRLDTMVARWSDQAALGVVMAAEGYPGDYRKGDTIHGLERIDDPGVKVFHAGTVEAHGEVLTAGGRVLCVTALGGDVSSAQARAYDAVQHIHWTGVHYRQDIGHRAVSREQAAR